MEAWQEVTEMRFSGNVIPPSWLKHVTYANGKPDMLGVFLLSDIVWWYRGEPIRNEHTGECLGYKKRFAADMYQRSNTSFADMYGATKRQVADALARLRDAGIIRIELRTIEHNGTKMSNVQFLAPVPEALKRITTPRPALSQANVIPITIERDTPITIERDTYTKTTDTIIRQQTNPLPDPPLFTPHHNPLPKENAADNPELLSAECADTDFSLPKKHGREEKIQQQALTVLDHYNTLRLRHIPRSRSFAPTPGNLAPIIRAIKQSGATLPQCTLTLDWWARYKIVGWTDGPQRFVPSTIFRREKFGEYLTLAAEWNDNGQPAPAAQASRFGRNTPTLTDQMRNGNLLSHHRQGDA